MRKDFDLVVTGGLLADGSGGPLRRGDIGVKAGRIAAVGRLDSGGVQEIDARGKLVTPGFIDLHTHYDGQVTWDNQIAASSAHGVTTVIMGNCGVGFAPCRAADRERLLSIMEGVEDIPEAVMTAGVPWNWESFPDYLDALAARRFDIDIAAQLPHSALRVFVMGERAMNLEAATPEDRQRMSALAQEAVEYGAVGFGTSRNSFHATRTGGRIPSYEAQESELVAIAEGLGRAGKGVLQAVPSFEHFDADFALFRHMVKASGRPLSFSMLQIYSHPDLWRHALALTEQANAEGLPIKAQVIGRATGILLGLDLSYHPFSFVPAYREIALLPLRERLRRMRDSAFKAHVLSQAPDPSKMPVEPLFRNFGSMFPIESAADYEPRPDATVAARAARVDQSAEAWVYDYLLSHEGRSILFSASANHIGGTLAAARTMITHPQAILGLGDGGAHYGLVCDSSYPSFMLSYWGRDRKEGRLAVEDLVRKLSAVPAAAVGLHDRGQIRVGLRADLNVIDFDAMELHPPRAHYDLPAGGRRVLQQVDGFDATLVHGTVIRRHGRPTDELPGRLVRA